MYGLAWMLPGATRATNTSQIACLERGSLGMSYLVQHNDTRAQDECGTS